MTEDRTLGEACLNPDGKTYNGVKLMQFLHSSVTGGKHLSEEEVTAMWEEAKKKKAAKR